MVIITIRIFENSSKIFNFRTGVSASGHVIELRAKAQPASNYRNSSVYENPSFLDDLSDEPLEIKKTISNNSLDGFSMEQLIQQLPTLELGEAENSVRVPQNLSAPRLVIFTVGEIIPANFVSISDESVCVFRSSISTY